MENPLRKLEIARHRLSNGLTVYLYQDPSVPLVAVNVNYKVGSKNERPGRTGFAHLFEHMMFEGSRHSNEHFIRQLQAIGAQVNGGTSTDRTRYWELVPEPYLDRALWLEADRMGFLLDAITQERLDNQRAVVKNERRQNYDNRPYGLVREQIAAVLYPPNHPYNWIPIGSMADLDQATLEDVQGFFRAFYTPNNAALCLAGDIDPDRALERVETWFGGLPPGPPVSRLASWVPHLSGDVELALEDRVELPRSQTVWHTVPLYHEDDAALDVAARVLGGGKTSRLYRALVYEQQVAQEASTSQASSELAGAFSLGLVPRPGHELGEVEQAAHAVLASFLAGGITPEELARAQVGITADFVQSMQHLGGFGGISDKINEYDHYLGEPDRFRWDLQRYLDLTPDRVVEAARRYLSRNRLVARVRPLGSVAPSPAHVEVDRSTAPARGADRPFRLPERQRFTLPNGLPVVLVEHRRVPMLQLSLVVRAGAAFDPSHLPGLASITAGLLQEGAGGRTSQEIAETLESRGAELQASTAHDVTAVSMSVLRPFVADALALFADVIARPDFLPEEIERVRRRRLVQFKQLADTPEYLASLAVTRTIFAGHPYGHLSNGTPEGIAAVTPDDVRAHWSRWFTPGAARLLVVGDIGRAEIEERLATAFAGWTGASIEPPALADPAPLGPRAIYLVDKPGAAQSMIVAAQRGVARTTPDHAALEVLNAAFGGQFVSRLNLKLREEKGFTYGARSAFDYRRVPGGFGVRVPVETAVTGPALAELLTEYRDIAGPRPLTADEIAFATGAMINGYAHRFETPGQIARELLDVLVYDLPDDAPERFPGDVRAVTPERLAGLAARTLTPDRLAIVIVGDAARVRTSLEPLDLGPLIEMPLPG